MADGGTNAAPTGRGQIPIVCPGHTRPLAELQFLAVPPGATGSERHRTLLLSACHDKLPMLRDGTSGDWIGTLQGHKGAVWGATLDGTAGLAATASGDFSVKIWDAVTGRELRTLPHGHIAKSCAFSPDSHYLATGGQEGRVRVYDLEALLLAVPSQSSTASSDPRWSFLISDDAAAAAGGKASTTISKVAWLDGSTLLAGCGDGRIRAWTIPSALDPGAATAADPSHRPVATLDTGTGKEVRDMHLTATPRTVVLTVAAGRQVFFFDMRPAVPHQYALLKQHTVPIHFEAEGGACLHPSGAHFLAGGSDLWVRRLDYATGVVLDCCKGHHGPIRCLRYSPDGATFASGSEDGTIRLWRVDPEQEEDAAAAVTDDEK